MARALGIQEGPESDWSLLAYSGSQPIGNLRIHSATSEKNQVALKRAFSIKTIVDRDRSFIEYLAELGEPISSFTGAGGASPKVLMRIGRDGNYYADGALPDAETARLVLLKFAMYEHTSDRDILRAEGATAKFIEQVGVIDAPRIQRYGDLLVILISS